MGKSSKDIRAPLVALFSFVFLRRCFVVVKKKPISSHLRRRDEAVSREIRRPAICPRGKGLLAEQGKALERARDDVAEEESFFYREKKEVFLERG